MSLSRQKLMGGVMRLACISDSSSDEATGIISAKALQLWKRNINESGREMVKMAVCNKAKRRVGYAHLSFCQSALVNSSPSPLSRRTSGVVFSPVQIE